MSSPQESEPPNPNHYNRKDKSLGVLCTNFLKLYDRDDVDSIGLDDAANRLDVERRRIYDIVNILESVGVLSKKAKNQYSWKGFGAIPRALDKLKEEALRENSSTSSCYHSETVSSENHYGGPSNSQTDRQDKPSVSSKVDNRKEKSLRLLAQNFIKLFLSSKVHLISLDDATKALLAKSRRLYDIANVFSSMDLIEKTQHPESKKPAFRWLGLTGSSKNGPATALDLKESKKRVFGTDVTNTLPKKYKADSSLDWNSNQKEQHGKHSYKGIVFGPFTPAKVAEGGDSEDKNVRREDLEDVVSSYRPQYRNQALIDLFDHYVAAWKSWYVEAAETKQIQEVS
ncbi:E2F transcription factor-like E2FF isoform X2 [Actinidia eriantha]|uniref:E2F transcription factor-like E2FF isoform X2 n=1 Tax=Actinidia eriantha TaxID=165200 RepID=UPI0025847AEC|nr:E2F transcription factor-like E2FF isoform X2 [Actinidia eriantha]